jgi:hypothetical protein
MPGTEPGHGLHRSCCAHRRRCRRIPPRARPLHLRARPRPLGELSVLFQLFPTCSIAGCWFSDPNRAYPPWSCVSLRILCCCPCLPPHRHSKKTLHILHPILASPGHRTQPYTTPLLPAHRRCPSSAFLWRNSVKADAFFSKFS